MTDQEMIDEVLEKFCHYLNLWWNHEPFNKDELNPYKPEQFTKWDPDQKLYGQIAYQVIDDGSDKVLLMQVSDGDDGGPSELTAMYRDRYGDGLEAQWIVHEFDTMPTFMWSREDGYRTPPKGEMEK